jgi:hypothetical protein
LSAGVELAEVAETAWLDERLFHYDVVVLGAAVDPDLLITLGRTQPQATMVPLSDLGGPADVLRARLSAVMAAAGVAATPSVRERELLT